MASIISAGTTSNTALNLSADTTGILQLASNGTTTALTIDTSQRVGIGLTNPSTPLDVYGAINVRSGYNVQWGTNANYIAANTSLMQFGVNGSERMRIDSSGNVGIGVTPNAWGSGYKTIQLTDGVVFCEGGANTYVGNNWFNDGANKYIATGAAALYEQGGGVHAWYTAASGTGGTAVTFSERMRIDSAGNVGIGTSSPTDTAGFSRALDLNGASGAAYYARTNGSATNFTAFGNFGVDGYISNRAAGILSFNNNGSERMRVTSGGNFLVGTTADITSGSTGIARSCFDSGSGQNGMKIKVNDDNYATIITTGSGTNHYAMYMNNSSGTNVGSIYCSSTATTYNTGSDYRLKENIAPMTGALAKVQQLKPCVYTWKADGSTGEGFIAHELQEIVPVCVNGEKDAVDKNGKPIYQGVDYSKLVTTLTAAIKEQQAMIEELKAEVQALKGAK
jgi:hypothetical protein